MLDHKEPYLDRMEKTTSHLVILDLNCKQWLNKTWTCHSPDGEQVCSTCVRKGEIDLMTRMEKIQLWKRMARFSLLFSLLETSLHLQPPCWEGVSLEHINMVLRLEHSNIKPYSQSVMK